MSAQGADVPRESLQDKGIRSQGFLLSHKPDVVGAGESLEGKGPGRALAEAGVETVKTEAGSLREVVEGMKIKDAFF